MFEHLRDQIKELIETNPKGYANILRFGYPELMTWIKDTYPSGGEGLYRWLYDVEPPLCRQCGLNGCEFNSIHNGGYRQFCSCSCRAKYNKSHRNAHTPDGKLKESAKAKISAAGAESRRKAQDTYRSVYGTDMYEDIVKKRAVAYNARIPAELKDVEYCSQVKIPLDQLALKLGVPYFMVLNQFREHGLSTQNLNISHVSAAENQVCELLDRLGVEYERSVRTLLSNRREIDIYVPSLKLGIEYCGLFWHSDRNHYSPTKHQEKFIDARDRGIKLITIFEDEWLYKQDIVVSRLTSLVKQNTRVFARKCVADTIDAKEATLRLNHWHIQGARNSAQNISLLYDDEVVAVMTYGAPRYGSEDVEIIRYATKPGVTVVGGFSKVLNHLKKMTKASTIVSYSDNRWGDGNVYHRAGMVRIDVTQPSYFYFLPAERRRYHRSTFMKHKVVEQMGGDANLTEVENMRIFGYNRIFDCGTTKWVWTAPVDFSPS